MTSLEALLSAEQLVRRHVGETPLHHWPLLSRRSGAEVWVKHENHTRIGAFKIRGGLVYMERLKARKPDVPGVIAATRGNHGQSVALAAGLSDIPATIVVPHGNSVEKNKAMRALGAELIEHGHDFQEALIHARDLAGHHGLHMLASFHDDLVCGVASYGLEIFRSHDDIDTVYVPIGLGSGLCGTLRARDAMASGATVVGVVAENAPCYARSFATGAPVTTNSCDTIADGMAVRVPHDDAVSEINAGAERIVTTSEDDIRAAMRHYFTDTHNVAEGAGAAPLAALMRERDRMAGRKVVLVLSGGNIDRGLFARILQDT
ncbi:MAG: threonine dehydratase [Deltaproteobacteria bacterium]|nr:threonine dehydratase [Deltaproteobacteria bacterium]